MTPEERFSRIEALQERQQEQLGRVDQEIEKQNEGTRALIVVGRTCLDSIKELREAQAATDDKLNTLVDTVDRIIRNRKNGQQ